MVRAGLEDKGQTVSKQDVRVEQKVSIKECLLFRGKKRR